MTRNPAARVRAAKQASEIHQWQEVAATTEREHRSRCGWCSCHDHANCHPIIPSLPR